MTDPMHQTQPPEPLARTECGAKTRSDGLCTNPPIRGGIRCRMHGGSAPGALAKAAEREAERKWRGMLKDMGTVNVTNPALELAKLAGQIVGWKELLLSKVDDLESLTTTSVAQGEQAKAVVSLLTAAFAESAKVLTNMTRLGLDAAALGHVMAQPSREQAEVLSRVLDHVLAGLDLTEVQRGQVPAVLSDALAREGLV